MDNQAKAMEQDIKVETSDPRITFVGSLTEAYEGDPKIMIDKLNLLRAEELVTELIYRHQAYIAVSLAMPGVKAEFEEHATQEAKHADMLAERISQLGGSPVFAPDEIAKGAEALRIEFGEPKTLEEMLAFDLKIERKQIVQYTRMIREVAFHDPSTRRILEDILIDTEHHATDLADLLSKQA
jgi:bacterioferritin